MVVILILPPACIPAYNGWLALDQPPSLADASDMAALSSVKDSNVISWTVRPLHPLGYFSPRAADNVAANMLTCLIELF